MRIDSRFEGGKGRGTRGNGRRRAAVASRGEERGRLEVGGDPGGPQLAVTGRKKEKGRGRCWPRRLAGLLAECWAAGRREWEKGGKKVKQAVWGCWAARAEKKEKGRGKRGFGKFSFLFF
jgi:hypothetical protein